MKTLIVDCANLAVRCWKVMPVLTNSTGKEVHVIYGVMKSLRAAIEKFGAEKVIAVFDGSPMARREIYPEYKSERTKARAEFTPDEQESYRQFRLQVDDLRRLLPLFGVVAWFHPLIEADDVIAELSVRLSQKVDDEVTILSEDKDFIQLVRQPNLRLFRPISNKEYTVDNFQDQTGFSSPEQYLNFRFINGDSSDGIPPVPGFGGKEGKRATELIQKFVTVNNIFKTRSELPKGKTYQILIDSKSIVIRNQLLMDLKFSKDYISQYYPCFYLDETINNSIFDEKDLKNQLIKLEFVSILNNFRTFILPFKKLI